MSIFTSCQLVSPTLGSLKCCTKLWYLIWSKRVFNRKLHPGQYFVITTLWVKIVHCWPTLLNKNMLMFALPLELLPCRSDKWTYQNEKLKVYRHGCAIISCSLECIIIFINFCEISLFLIVVFNSQWITTNTQNAKMQVSIEH